MIVCADCTAAHAVVTEHRVFPCQHDSSAVLRPMIQTDLSVLAESADRAPRVSMVELAQLHVQGRELYRRHVMRATPWEPTAEHRRAAADAVKIPWGGVTLGADGPVSPESGYAVAVDVAHHEPNRLPARVRAPYLGVFRDDEKGTVDIDLVVIVPNRRQANALGVYCQSTGGAYSFADGLGYWTPTL